MTLSGLIGTNSCHGIYTSLNREIPVLFLRAGFLLGSGGFERLRQAWTGADGELEPAAVALGS